MGLEDPQVTNNAYGAKIWWCWVKETTTPWVKLWGKTLVALGQRNFYTLGKPMEGKVCPGHSRQGQNLLQRNQGRFSHLEPSLVQQSLDSDRASGKSGMAE
jgi:hypothetical protein